MAFVETNHHLQLWTAIAQSWQERERERCPSRNRAAPHEQKSFLSNDIYVWRAPRNQRKNSQRSNLLENGYEATVLFSASFASDENGRGVRIVEVDPRFESTLL